MLQHYNLLLIRRVDMKPIGFVRHYPASDGPKSKFSENTTEKELQEFKENVETKVKELKDREQEEFNKFSDYFYEKCWECTSKSEVETLRDKTKSEQKALSAIYQEEVKQDLLGDIHEKLDNSNFTKEGIEMEKRAVEAVIGKLINEEGRVLERRLQDIDETCDNVSEFYDDAEGPSDSDPSDSNPPVDGVDSGSEGGDPSPSNPADGGGNATKNMVGVKDTSLSTSTSQKSVIDYIIELESITSIYDFDSDFIE